MPVVRYEPPWHNSRMPPRNIAQRSIEPTVPHYYGDVARVLMLCGAGLALLVIPFSSGFLHDAFVLDIIVGLAIVASAALTNPHSKLLALSDAVLSAVAVVFFEIDAFQNYQAGELTTFVFYEGITILFMLAFYFSLKTLRAFMLHQVGKRDSLADFGGRSTSIAKENPLEKEESYKPKLMGDD